MAPGQDELDAVWRALSDPARRRILDLLRERPRTVGEICEPFAESHSRFAVMKHLGVLKQAGLVVDRKDGRRRWNHLNVVPLRRVYERWVTRYESAWAESLLALRRHVEGEQAMPEKIAGEPAVGEFVITQEVEINAPRQRAFEALLDVDGWWTHYYGDTKPKLVLEPFPGGRFYQTGNGEDAFFGAVQHLRRPDLLRLIGPLGMGKLPVTSVYEFRLEDRADRTLLKLTHRAFGVLDPEWKAAHEKGWGELWPLLKGLAETGKRYSGT